MLDPLTTGPVAAHAAPAQNRKVLQWRENDRTAGMVPVWQARSAARTQIEQNLADAATGGGEKGFSAALAYARTDEKQVPYQNAQEFGFGDLVDMVNPLQHVPVVGHLYRELTGDDIRPIAKIIGGGVYGGGVGIAAGLVDTVVEYETGRSLTGNVVALVTDGETPRYRSDRQDAPEKRLNAAIAALDENRPPELPGTALAFADLGNRAAPPQAKVTRYSYND